VYGYLKTRLNRPVSEPSIPSGRCADVDRSHRILGHDSVIFNIEVCTLRVCVCMCVCVCVCLCASVDVFAYIHACAYACISACLCAYIGVHISVCIVVNNICLCTCSYAVIKSVMGCMVSVTI
jgi:hypothetical protein